MTQATDRPVAPNVAAEIPSPRVSEAPAAAAAAPALPEGDPGMIALPGFIAAATALGLVLVGFAPATATGASIPIIMTAGGFALLISAIWAARLGQNANAAVFGVFAGFWFSYAALVLGLTHNWFGIPATGVVRTEETFLIAWLVVVGALTLASLRLPIVYVGLFALVEVALLLVLLGTVNGSTGLTKAGGYVVFAFTVLGLYLFGSGMSTATGGKPYPLGPPVLR